LKFLAIKASKSGLLVQKSGGLSKFCCTGGLIKSGGLYALIWYVNMYACIFANIDNLKERSHLFLQKYACQIFKIRLDLNLDDVIKERVHN